MVMGGTCLWCGKSKAIGLTTTDYNTVLSAQAFAKKAAETLKDTDGDYCKSCRKMGSAQVCLVDGQCYSCYLYPSMDPIDRDWENHSRFPAIDLDGDWNNCSCCNARISPLKTMCRECTSGQTKSNWDYTPIMNNKPKVSGNATKTRRVLKEETKAALWAFYLGGIATVVPVGAMLYVGAVKEALFYAKQGLLVTAVIALVAATVVHCTKEVK